jgi:hypothetical protein
MPSEKPPTILDVIYLVFVFVIIPLLIFAGLFSLPRPPSARAIAVVSVGAVLIIGLALWFRFRGLARWYRGKEPYLPVVVIIVTFTIFLWLVGAFSVAYWYIGKTSANFDVTLSRLDAVYFTMGILSRAGTGTIAPHSELARAIITGQEVADILFIAFVLGTVASASRASKS